MKEINCKYVGVDWDRGVLTCNVRPEWDGAYWVTREGCSLGLLDRQPQGTKRGQLFKFVKMPMELDNGPVDENWVGFSGCYWELIEDCSSEI